MQCLSADAAARARTARTTAVPDRANRSMQAMILARRDAEPPADSVSEASGEMPAGFPGKGPSGKLGTTLRQRRRP